MERKININEKEVKPVIIGYGDEVIVVKVDAKGDEIEGEKHFRYSVLDKNEMKNKPFSYNTDPSLVQYISDQSNLGKALFGQRIDKTIFYSRNDIRAPGVKAVTHFIRVLSIKKIRK